MAAGLPQPRCFASTMPLALTVSYSLANSFSTADASAGHMYPGSAERGWEASLSLEDGAGLVRPRVRTPDAQIVAASGKSTCSSLYDCRAVWVA